MPLVSSVEETGEGIAAGPSGVREHDMIPLRLTNYTDDGYPVRIQIGGIRSYTRTQTPCWRANSPDYPFIQNLPFNVRLYNEAIRRVPVKEIIRRFTLPGGTRDPWVDATHEPVPHIQREPSMECLR